LRVFQMFLDDVVGNSMNNNTFNAAKTFWIVSKIVKYTVK